MRARDGEDGDVLDIRVELETRDTSLATSTPTWSRAPRSSKSRADARAAAAIPDDPTTLSYLLSGIIQVELPRRQALLEADTTVERLVHLLACSTVRSCCSAAACASSLRTWARAPADAAPLSEFSEEGEQARSAKLPDGIARSDWDHGIPERAMNTGRTRVAPTVAARRQPLTISGDLVIAVVIVAAAPMFGFWIGHGGLQQFATAAGAATAVGQLTALAGTYLALVQLVLMSRSPWLDRTFGMDRLAVWHRWLGFATVWLLVAHGVFTTVGFAAASDTSIIAEAWAMVTTYPFVLMAVASLGLFILVAVSSVRWARRRLSYETWYGLHLYAYLAIVLGSAHQLVVGTDFMDDALARAYWILLYAAVVVLILAFRVGQPIATSLHHGLRVANIVAEGPGVVSIYLTGRDLEQLQADAGQYFQWRFLTRATWWRTHPFSLSAAPNGRWLRITVKALGDDTRALGSLPIGTKVFVEGPYGALTLARRSRRGVLLIAGGIGIAPIRALTRRCHRAPATSRSSIAPAVPRTWCCAWSSTRSPAFEVIKSTISSASAARGCFRLTRSVPRQSRNSCPTLPSGTRTCAGPWR